MKITVTDGNSIHSYDVDDNEEIENIKALIEAEVPKYAMCRLRFLPIAWHFIIRGFPLKTTIG